MIRADEIGRIVFGCGNIGGLGSNPALRDKGDSRERGLELLDQARRVGITRFDTANAYGGGLSETVLGEWFSRQGPAFRHAAEVATKVGNPAGSPPGERPLSRAEIARHLDESLRRLKVERVGVYYLHEFDRATPLEETFEAIEAAARAGKIAAFGVSNATLADLQAAVALARASRSPSCRTASIAWRPATAPS
jgi:aryl-alcohol dehydrogenase-like predicted oxidoreductase